MGLFSKGKTGGMMNVIRCDEKEYLVWKWRPEGQELGASKRENGIRYGSSLRVKDGEVAILVYTTKENEDCQEVIVGPQDKIINTANFPVLADIVGLGYGGDTPFQAEVYFINLSENVQILFGVPYFDVFDPRFPDFPVPVAVRGTITFNISDYSAFIKNNRLINFEIKDFKQQIRSAVMKYTKSIVMSLPASRNIPVVQLESQILQVNDALESYLRPRFEKDFGVCMKALDIEAVEINKDSETYKELKRVTKDIASETVIAQSDVNIQNLRDSQRIMSENMEESLRIQREEAQRAQRLKTETSYIGAHALNRQADVMQTAAESLGKIGGTMGDGSGNDGFNPAGMMTGMMMGGAIGSQMAGYMNQMGQNLNAFAQQNMQAPPPIPKPVSYYVLIDNQQSGPFDENALRQMASSGQLSEDTYVWKQGMAQWMQARDTELNKLFASVPPVPPPFPPTPPTK